MADLFLKFTGRINRRLPNDEGKINDPILRENWLARDGILKKPQGNEVVVADLESTPRWIQRYNSIESSVVSPKTFVYTENGKIRVLDDNAGTSSEVKDLLKENAYPKSQLFKTGDQNKMFIVDGEGLYSHDGNNDNTFLKVDLTDADGDSVNPIDVIEHRDRLIVISKTRLFISKNLDPDVFDDATDSIEIIVGSGRGINLSLGKIEDKLYILNSEGIFALDGDVISALASTFEVRLVDERKIIAGRTAVTVEKAIVFLADDFELWSWNGTTSELLTYEFKLKDFVNEYREMLDKAVAIYEDNYYKMSFVEKGEVEPNIEIWWDAFENKVDVVKGRHVACYMKTDPNVENQYVQLGMSNFEESTFLSHFDGNDGATEYTAESGQVITFEGTAQLDTAQKKFGRSSLKLDGTTAYVTALDSDKWNFGTDDLTIDAQVKFNAINKRQPIVSQYEDATHYWSLELNSSNQLSMIFINGSTVGRYIMSGASGFAVDTRYHVVFVRSGTGAYIFIDGISQALTEVTAFGTNDLGDLAASLYIGKVSVASFWFDGWIDEFRIIKGTAKWTSDFTPPTEKYYNGEITQDYRNNLFNGSEIATRLRTRAITPKSGQNVRFLAFYPKFSPTGDRDITIRYLLDGRSSNLDDTAHFVHNLRGETIKLGFIEIKNQEQFTGRYRPKIKYSRGESIAFEIIEATASLKADFLGMGIDFIGKYKSRGSKVGA